MVFFTTCPKETFTNIKPRLRMMSSKSSKSPQLICPPQSKVTTLRNLSAARQKLVNGDLHSVVLIPVDLHETGKTAKIRSPTFSVGSGRPLSVS